MVDNNSSCHCVISHVYDTASLNYINKCIRIYKNKGGKHSSLTEKKKKRERKAKRRIIFFFVTLCNVVSLATERSRDFLSLRAQRSSANGKARRTATNIKNEQMSFFSLAAVTKNFTMDKKNVLQHKVTFGISRTVL